MTNPIGGAVYIFVNLKYVTKGTFGCTFKIHVLEKEGLFVQGTTDLKA